jgi:hypothetical protein
LSLGSKFVANVPSVERRQFRLDHERRLERCLVSGFRPRGEFLGFPILVHLRKDLQLVVASRKELVQLVVVKLILLFGVVFSSARLEGFRLG